MSPALAGRRVLMVVNAEWYFLSHRLSLALALKRAGAEVTVMTADERGQTARITAAGFRHVLLPLARRSRHPVHEIRTVVALWQTYRALRPDIVHHITIKPVIYGSIVARVLRVPAILNTVPGLGFMFSGQGWRARARRTLATTLYRLALGGPRVRVIVQNDDDRRLFIEQGVVAPERVRVIRGSGVDPDRYVVLPEPSPPAIVLFASRLLWDKGLGDFVDAARRLRRAGTDARFVIVGTPDVENPQHVPEATVRAWVDEGVVEWWGHRDDMPQVLAQVHVVVLPTRYPEGVPKILIEAASCGRAIVTSDAPGCRDLVVHEQTGLLVPVGDAGALSAAVSRLLGSAELRARYGTAARARVEAHFSEARVLDETLEEYALTMGAAR